MNARYLLLALLLTGSSALADAVGPSSYECFDATQTTGVGVAFSGTCSGAKG